MTPQPTSLLGDPGTGKTHAFRDAAARCGGRVVTARAFMAAPVKTAGGTLFIDGLDERRAGRSDRGTIDELVGKLFAATPERLRISCRIADWLGESDLTALALTSSGAPIVDRNHLRALDRTR